MLFPSEVISPMINLSVEIPGPVQLIITSLKSTPSTVLTIQLTFRGLPTTALTMGPGGCIVTVGSGTMDYINTHILIHKCIQHSPSTFNIMLLEAAFDGFALINTSHPYILALNDVLNIDIM